LAGFSFSMALVTVTRRVRFNAAHRLHNPDLSDAENQRLFGVCNSPNYHGHNYELEIAVRGPIDDRSGYVIDLAVLQRIADEVIVERLDHRNLNLDVEFLHGINPTVENLVVACWWALAPKVAPGHLQRLRLWETENNYAEFEGA
jgi:6-pyruvoyltetrahydropterin/6-carboxytetrahydropterin synthase